MAQNSGNRGFGSMDRDEQRRISSMGGRASHGGRGREDYNRDYESDYDEDYDDDYGSRQRSSYRDEDYDDDYDSDDREEDYDDEGGSRGGRGRSSGTSNRGFASMDRDEVRRLASMGGRASHESGRGHEWDSEEAREAGRRGGQASHGGGRGYSSYDDDDNGRRSNRGSRWEEDDDYGSSRGRRNVSWEDEDDDRGRGSNRGGGRGFASMDPEEQRRIASMGGRASHGGRGSDYNSGGRGNSGRGDSDRDYGRRSNSGSRYNDDDNRGSGSSRRGFAAMSKQERTRIARMGGEASHGGGRGRNSSGRR